MIAATVVVHTITDRPPDVEVEPDPDGFAWLAWTDGDARVVVHGSFDTLLSFVNGAADLLVDAQARHDAQRIAERGSTLFDDDEDAKLGERCLHPRPPIGDNGLRCPDCDEAVPW